MKTMKVLLGVLAITLIAAGNATQPATAPAQTVEKLPPLGMPSFKLTKGMKGHLDKAKVSQVLDENSAIVQYSMKGQMISPVDGSSSNVITTTRLIVRWPTKEMEVGKDFKFDANVVLAENKNGSFVAEPLKPATRPATTAPATRATTAPARH